MTKKKGAANKRRPGAPTPANSSKNEFSTIGDFVSKWIKERLPESTAQHFTNAGKESMLALKTWVKANQEVNHAVQSLIDHRLTHLENKSKGKRQK